MSRITQGPATLTDLEKVEGKAELIGGRIVHLMPTGHTSNQVAKRIMKRLDDFVEAHLPGHVYTDNMGFAIEPPLPSGRQSFSPDASYYLGPLTNPRGFVEGTPTFAVEVRSEHDYGPAKDREYADKRKDYFFAGTLVVWDVDPDAKTVTVYKAADPLLPTVYGPGTVAEAEPAVPGWRLKIDDLFR